MSTSTKTPLELPESPNPTPTTPELLEALQRLPASLYGLSRALHKLHFQGQLKIAGPWHVSVAIHPTAIPKSATWVRRDPFHNVIAEVFHTSEPPSHKQQRQQAQLAGFQQAYGGGSTTTARLTSWYVSTPNSPETRIASMLGEPKHAREAVDDCLRSLGWTLLNQADFSEPPP